MFIPKRIYIKPQSLNTPKAKEIIARARTLDPSVQIINLQTKEFQYPPKLSPKNKFFFMKDSVILSERAEPFIKTFASPGDIVESLNTVLNYSWMCPSNCEYCYLQTTQTLEHYIYTNLEDLEDEFVTAFYAHKAILTIWSMLSFAMQQPLYKIPPGLMDYADQLRENFTDKRIINDKRAIDWLYLQQHNIYQGLKEKQSEKAFGVTEKEFKFKRKRIEELYTLNSIHRLRMIPSEFCDMVAVDHLTKNIAHLAQMVAKTPDVEIDIRTKSSQIEDIRSFSGSGRITFAISINTEHVISKYEHGTATLDERLAAARTVQEADGYNLDLVIEPFIKYDNCIQDYISLIGKISKAIDLKKVRKISLGSARYKKQLRSRISRNFPSTDLFDQSQDLQEPEKNDYRLRYSIDYLTETYTALRKEIAKHTPLPISLTAEKPELWHRLSLNPDEHITKSVYQYSENAMSKEQQKPESAENEDAPTPEIDLKGEIEESLEYRCAITEITESRQEIDIESFENVEQRLDNLEYNEDVVDENGNTRQISIDLWDTIETVTVKTARRTENLWQPVKVIGRIKAITPGKPLELFADGKSQILPVRIITFEDKENTPIELLAYPEELLPANIDSYLTSRKLLILKGCIVDINRKKGRDYRFYLRNIITQPSMTDLVGIPESPEIDPGFTIKRPDGEIIGIPKNDPYLIISKYGYSERQKKDGKELFDFIKDSLVKNLKLLGDEYDASHLETGLEFVILQSLSQGKTDGFSNKLHGLIIGPPNVGKSLLTEGAKAINPVANEISPVGPKITAAGLIGKVVEIGGKTISEGGKIPMLSGGTLCFQEFHQIKDKRSTIHNIFSNLMEKGIVQDDTSARTTLEAEVSLLVDTNRYHQVNKNKPVEANTFSDLDIPIHILSRYDFILDIPDNAERQRKVSEQIGLKTSPQSDSWKAELKSLIAFLRDEYIGVTVSDEIDSYAKEKLKSLFEEFKSENFETNIQDHQPRIARSLKKYVFAISRAWARPVVTEEHIDFALKFIRQKLIFLSNQKFDERKLDGRSKKIEERAKLVIDHFKNSSFTRLKLKEFYGKQYGSAERINISREIKTLLDAELIQQVKRGAWRVVSSKDSAQPQKPKVAKKSIHKRKT